MRRRTADLLVVALAAAGLLVAGYLTLLHYDSSVPLVCGAGTFVNCEAVLTSPSAFVAGVPVAVWGVVWFAVALALAVSVYCHPLERGRVAAATQSRLLSRAWTVIGAVGVLYLVYQEVGVLGKICAWCTAVHVIILTMLILQFAER